MADFMLEGFRVFNKADTYMRWYINNPVLGAGEIGFENDTYRIKVGDGETGWNDLPYTNVTEITDIEVSYTSDTPTTIANLPANFFLNVLTVSIDEAWNSNVIITIGTDDDPTWIVSKENICLTDEGYVFVYRVNEMITEATSLKVFINGSRTKGKLTINIK